MPDSHSWIGARVAERIEIATDIVRLTLASAQGRALPPFSAGAHINVEAAPGVIRQYSLCNSPREADRYVIAVLREPESRGGSEAMHALRVGQPIRIDAPRNHFPLDRSAARSLLFAGGIGITPILCMAGELAEADADFTLHYCARSADRAAFREALAAEPLSAHAHIHFGDRQRIDLSSAVGEYRPGSHLYVCGPARLIDEVLETGRLRGWPELSLHREYFAPPEEPEQAPSGTFTVKLAASGITLEVPEDRTVADVLREAGIDVPMSCEQGVCGTCLTPVLEGEPDHRDYFLNEEERARNDQFTLCCSRSKTPLLVIDL